MIGFLGELGAKLADRWLSLLVLPGALLVVAAAVADILRQAHALDLTLLRARITAVATTPAAHSPGVLLLAIGGILAASALAGLAGGVLGNAISRLWETAGPAEPPGAGGFFAWIGHCFPAYWLTALRTRSWRRRDSRWQRAWAASEPLRSAAALIARGMPVPSLPHDTTSSSVSTRSATGTASTAEILAASRAATHAADAALRRRNRICLYEPSRPTWIADRFHATERRITTSYHLDLALAWPRLWTLLQGNLRTDLTSAYDAYTAASRLVGWALLYAAIGLWWWPSLAIAAVAAVTGWTRGRTAAAVLAELIEAAVDLHGRSLAAQLGLACYGPLSPNVGYEITAYLRKDPS